MTAIKDRRLGDAACRVFCCLCGHADEAGMCRVAAATMAKELGKARSTVAGHLNTLESLGYCTKRAAFRADGGKAANRYWVARNGLPEIPCDVGSAEMGNDYQVSLLFPVDGKAAPKKSKSGMPDQPTSHVGPTDIPCRPITDIHKEHTRRTDSPSPAGTSGFDHFAEFQPAPEIIAIAQELGIDEHKLIEDWKDWHRAHGKPFPVDPDASLRRWARKQPQFSDGRGPLRSQTKSPKWSDRSSLIESALNRARG
jgi:hypothetical protein